MLPTWKIWDFYWFKKYSRAKKKQWIKHCVDIRSENKREALVKALVQPRLCPLHWQHISVSIFYFLHFCWTLLVEHTCIHIHYSKDDLFLFLTTTMSSPASGINKVFYLSFSSAAEANSESSNWDVSQWAETKLSFFLWWIWNSNFLKIYFFFPLIKKTIIN